MNLFKTELHRLLRRRLSLLFGIIALAGLVMLSLVLWFNSYSEVPPGEQAYAEEQAAVYQAEMDYCKTDEDYFEKEWAYDVSLEYPELSREEVCEEMLSWGTQPSDHYMVYIFDFSLEGVWILAGAAIVGGLLAMLLAASGIGAEWSSGNMANLLVWHPNRMRVWGAKLAASLTIGAAGLVALLLLGFGLLYLVAATSGNIGELDGRWWEESLGVLGRTVAMGLGMTVLGSALAMLGRHTAIAGGVIAGYLIIGDLLVRLAGFAFNVKYPDLFSLYTWVGAWITGEMTLFPRVMSMGSEERMVLTATDAGLMLGAIVALFAGLATWSFAKRDVA